jgi:hypothetical protein
VPADADDKRDTLKASAGQARLSKQADASRGRTGDANMLKLTQEAFSKARAFVIGNARGVDQALFAHYFEQGSPGDVLCELASYQNDDGGFGRWLESDFALPDSSPAASVVGFEYLRAVDAPATLDIVKRGIDYFLATFEREQQRWHAVPKEVNDVPHAPWWHYRKEIGGCVIDRSLGNPGAEIVGYLNRYRELVPSSILEQVTESFIERLHALPDKADSMHEILCYLRMTENLPARAHAACFAKVQRLIQHATETDPAKWGEYGATPLFFVTSKESPLVDLFPEALAANLDYLIQAQDEDGSWKPNWSWGQYDEAWQEARRRWSGQLTVRNLRLLSNFDRLDRAVL